MGKFANFLTESLNPAAATASSIAGIMGTVGSWLGIGQKRQVAQQKELQEHAAKLNYEYGEKSAENAFARQMQSYAQSYSDNTLKNQVNQARDAGLSVGLLYGGGAQGGGEGSLSGGTQGTGASGIAAGQAPSAGIEMQGLALMQQGAKNAAEIQLMNSQSKVNEAKAEEMHESAEKMKAETATINEMREYIIEGENQKAINMWLSNVEKRLELEGDEDSMVYENKALKMMVIIGESSYSRQTCQFAIENAMQNKETQEALQKYYEETGATQESIQCLNAAMEAWYDEKTKYVFQEVYNDYMKAFAELKNANTNEFNAEVERQWKNAQIKIQTYLANLKRSELDYLIQKANMEYDGSFGNVLLRGAFMILGGVLGSLIGGPAGAAAGAGVTQILTNQG